MNTKSDILIKLYFIFISCFIFQSFQNIYGQQDTSRTNIDTSAVILILNEIELTDTKKDTIEFEDKHIQDAADNRGFLIMTADKKSQLRIMGSVRVNGAYDFNGLQNKSSFSTFDIPVGSDNVIEPRFFLSASQSRYGIEAKRETRYGDAFVRLESDFLGKPNLFRLRHAYGTLGGFLIGQTWSAFGDIISIPATVDIDGPNSSVAERTVQIRYRNRINNNFNYAIAIESPEPEITTLDSAKLKPAFQSFPDLIARIGTNKEWGHLQIAGIFRSITIKDTLNNLEYQKGYGILFSGRIIFKEHEEFLFQAVYGEAISRFITTFAGRGLDVVYNEYTEKFEPVEVFGTFFSYKHKWNKDLASFFTFGFAKIFTKDFYPETAYSQSGYFSTNVFWKAAEGTRIGSEFSFGRRVNKNGESGNASRLSFIIYYDF